MPITLATPSLTWETLKAQPALSVGLPIFTLFLLIIDLHTDHSLSTKFSYYPGAIFDFDLNRLSFYLLFHQNYFHWFLNVTSLWTIMSTYERINGTIYTGVTLNLLAVFTGIQYTIIGTILGEDAHVAGLSGVVFSFVAYTAYKEHFTSPTIYKINIAQQEIEIPTLLVPFIFLILGFVLTPGASHWGHACGISTGFLLGMGYMKVLFPPHNAIAFIEGKVTPLINLIDKIVTFIKETDSVHQRSSDYTPILGTPLEA